jgi:hypothetical protein
MSKALSQHWPEYLMEALGLGVFMLSACVCAVLLEHPGAVLHQALPDPLPLIPVCSLPVWWRCTLLSSPHIRE